MGTHYILLDYQGVQPKNLLGLPDVPGECFRVIVFRGSEQQKIEGDLMPPLERTNIQVQGIKVSGSAKNKINCMLAYYLGQLVTRDPDGAFHVISKDPGYDPLIKHLKKNVASVDRHGSLAGIPGFTDVEEIPGEEEGEETSGYEEAPDGDKSLADEEVLSGTGKEVLSVEELLADEEAPVDEEESVDEKAFADEEAPVDEEEPVDEEAFADEEAPVDEEEPVDEEAFADEEAPVDEEEPVDEEAFADEQAPVDEEEPVDEPAPVLAKAPKAKAAPTGKKTRSRRTTAAKVRSVRETPTTRQAVTKKGLEEERLAMITKEILGHRSTRPRKWEKLKSAINDLFNNELQREELVSLLKELQKQEHIIVDRDRVTYPDT